MLPLLQEQGALNFCGFFYRFVGFRDLFSAGKSYGRDEGLDEESDQYGVTR